MASRRLALALCLAAAAAAAAAAGGGGEGEEEPAWRARQSALDIRDAIRGGALEAHSLTCSVCGTRVAHMRDMFYEPNSQDLTPATVDEESVAGLSYFFENDEGHGFQVAAFRHLANVEAEADKSPSRTWFPPYVWQIVRCKGCGEQLGWRFSLPPDAAARRAAPATSPRVPPASPFPRRGGGAGPKGAGEEGEEEEDEEDEEDEEGEGDPADTRALPSAFFALILDRVVFQRAARQLLDLFLAV